MRGFLLLFALLVISFLSTFVKPRAGLARPDESVVAKTVDLTGSFEGLDGCFVLLDVSTGEILRYRRDRCSTRLSPCSTFKIPNALIGLETGVIPDADHVMQWDGKRRSRKVTNRDHDLASAVAQSVVWYFQRLAEGVGLERMQKLVNSFDYGNRDLSAGLTEFWLGSSLEISADEQTEFLRRLHERELPLSRRAMDIVLDLIVLDRRDDVVFRGKTGSCRGEENDPDLGWFVGSVERADGVKVFAVNVLGEKAWGTVARRIAERSLRRLGEL